MTVLLYSQIVPAWYHSFVFVHSQANLSGTICRGFFPSVLWHCWLGDRKGIRSVKSAAATIPKCLPDLTWNNSRKVSRLNKNSSSIRCAKTARQNFFACRIINVWNSLPTSVCFNSLACFKNSIKDVDFSIYVKCY